MVCLTEPRNHVVCTVPGAQAAGLQWRAAYDWHIESGERTDRRVHRCVPYNEDLCYLPASSFPSPSFPDVPANAAPPSSPFAFVYHVSGPGSYIFSQTIFTLRAGVQSRLCTAVVVVLEAAAFVSPVSIIAYVPRFFFGGLLGQHTLSFAHTSAGPADCPCPSLCLPDCHVCAVLIATDLMVEWLVSARSKMMAPEYFTCICTFFAIQVHPYCST